MITLRLNQAVHQKIAAGHPWIFADAIDPPKHLKTGDEVTIETQSGDFLGRGLFERNSPIAVRIWTLKNEAVDDTLLFRRITEADQQRRRWLNQETTGVRLLNGEGDRTPGVVCDLYGDCAVLRIDGRAAERWIDPAIEALKSIRDVRYFVVRRSEKYRDDHPKAEWVSAPKNSVDFLEEGARFVCDPIMGQKTGFFLDQRANRRLVGQWSKNRRVLNLFGYTGGFSLIAALAGAAHTTTVDLAKPALDMAQTIFDLNQIDVSQHAFIASDVEKYLATFHKRTAPFDVVVCDPPSYAHRKKDKAKATKSYTRLFAKTLHVMPKGSTVALASCSSHIGRKDFRAIVAAASKEAEVEMKVHGLWGADVDHPFPIGFPEHDYLQFLLATI